jgi:hypothetical protein
VPIAIFLTICVNILFLIVTSIVVTIQIIIYILFYNENNDFTKPYFLEQIELLCDKYHNDSDQYPFDEVIKDYDIFCLTMIKNMYCRFWEIVDMYKQLKK